MSPRPSPLAFRSPRVRRNRRANLAAAILMLNLVPLYAWGQPQFPTPFQPIYGEAATTQALKFANAEPDDELLPIEINGYWGLINQSGRVITLPRFDWTDTGVEGLARATHHDKTGFISGNVNWRFDPIYEYADRFEAGYAVVGDGEKFTYIDKAGKVRLDVKLDAALRFREGWAGVRIGDRCGFINTRFEPITPMRFTAVRSVHEGLAAVRLPPASAPADPASTKRRGDKQKRTTETEVFDVERIGGKPDVADLVDDEDETIDGGVPHPDNSTGVWGYLNKSGKLAFRDTSGEIQELGDFNDGLARYRAGGRWGYLDRKFRTVVPPRYEEARDFTDGLAAVKEQGKWGYIDRRYRVVIPFTYEDADDFDDSLAMVEDDGKFGFINRAGREVVRPQFDSAEPFRLGVARVQVGDSFGYIKTSGYPLYDPRNARLGIIDITLRERARAEASRWRPYNQSYLPPPPRENRDAPYPPEHLYEEGLAVPEMR